MNKLGFYVENTTVQYLRDALSKVKPPTLLIHAGDRGLLREIRAGLSPDTFVIGRMFVDQSQQTAWLSSGDPAAHGRTLAEQIIGYDFGLAAERGANGRLLIDAWLGLNEPVRGPASFASGQPDAETRQRLDALDRFQEAFYLRLQDAGLAAVAFNFGAGNFTTASHYLDYFPRTLARYQYLGFHEYGWPTLEPSDGASSCALFYRQAMPEIRQKYANRAQAIITEAGLARMYKHANDAAGDVGWLYPGETIPQSQYLASLAWYNTELLKDDYVLGACLFNYGPSGRWETFRHLGTDTQARPILLTDAIASWNSSTPPPPPPFDKVALRKRVYQVQGDLDAVIGQCDAVLKQVAAVGATLQEPATALTGVISPAEVQTLIGRIDAITAALKLLAQKGGAGVDVAALQAQADKLLRLTRALQTPAGQAAQLQQRLQAAQTTARTLTEQIPTVSALKSRAEKLQGQADRLLAQLGLEPQPLPDTPVPQPVMHDKRAALPVRPGAAYPNRPASAIKRVILHHTVTRDDVTPERLAQAQVGQGKPGITYHFLVNGNGTISWTQPLEAVVDQTLLAGVNADGVAVALAGNFQNAAPTPAQMDSAAQLIAWLLSSLGLDTGAIYGRNELDKRVSSPGVQWLQGSRYKDTLLTQVKSVLAGTR